MIHYLQIKDGVVVNRAIADGPLPNDFFPSDETWVQNDEADIGWSYDGDTFTPPPPPFMPPGEMVVVEPPPPSRAEFDALEARVAALEAK